MNNKAIQVLRLQKAQACMMISSTWEDWWDANALGPWKSPVWGFWKSKGDDAAVRGVALLPLQRAPFLLNSAARLPHHRQHYAPNWCFMEAPLGYNSGEAIEGRLYPQTSILDIDVLTQLAWCIHARHLYKTPLFVKGPTSLFFDGEIMIYNLFNACAGQDRYPGSTSENWYTRICLDALVSYVITCPIFPLIKS